MEARRMTDEQLTAMPQHHFTHFDSVAASAQSMADDARTIRKALEDMWKANDGLPYLERKLQEAIDSIMVEKMGEATSVNLGYIAVLERIADLMKQIFNKRHAHNLAYKQMRDARESLINSQNYMTKYQIEVPGVIEE